jgi:hypothetical protein
VAEDQFGGFDHGEGFATACLSVGEAGSFGSFKSFANEGQHTGGVNSLVALVTVKHIIKLEL